MPLLTAFGVVCAANLVLGWRWGYHALGAYLGFWCLAFLVLTTSWNVVSRLFRSASRAEAAVRVAVVAFAIIVLCGLALGSLGQLTVRGYFVAEAALWCASWLLPEGDRDAFPETSFTLPASMVGVGAALVAFTLAFAVAHAPMTLYDAVSYHLFFAARWVQEHTLSIVPTPFSDAAQAYAPANGELFFVWLLLPFHGDLMARLGQFPFGVAAVVTLYAMARRFGATALQAVYPCAFFALSRPILEQAIGADVDLVCATMFLASMYFGFVAL